MTATLHDTTDNAEMKPTAAPERIWAEPDGNDILIHNGAPDLDVLIGTGYLTEYIRADLAHPAPAIAVKPLPWRNSYGVERADTFAGTWMIKGKIAEFSHSGFSMATGDNPKAEIQAKHDAFVESLVTTPSPDTREGADA